MKRKIRKLNRSEARYRNEILKSLPKDMVDKINYISGVEGKRNYVIIMKKVIILALKDDYSLSFPDIALLLKCDHSTIISHYKKVKNG